MTHQDYLAHAELYLGSDRQNADAQGPRGFRTAAAYIKNNLISFGGGIY